MNDHAAIEATLKQYETVLNASDVDGVLALYTDDGVFMPTEAPTAAGRDQVRGAYEHVFGTIKLDITFTIDEIASHGDVAFARTISRGDVTIRSQGVTMPEENRELFVLKKVGDAWKIARYMFNKMTPPAGR
ncbi:YybH family protein [Rhodocaloribacter sp.]